ncbi:CAP domain-containing protein [Micromonospora sp. NPDC049366]|uniref:CAP domain-containing protein n=1 Tax=Micromonospora sp. NPDC049366 TaxID=3364271 RepID=UPI0037A2D955
MYGRTDPNDPAGAARRPESPIGEPAWLTDRPEPRSAYLFGDDPEQPAETRRHDQPTDGRWAEPTGGWDDQPTGRWAAEPAPRDERATDGRHRDLPAGGWRDESSTHWSAERTDPWAADESTGRHHGPAAGGVPAEPPIGGWTTDAATEAWSTYDASAPTSDAWPAYDRDSEPTRGGWSAYGERDGGPVAGTWHVDDATAPISPPVAPRTTTVDQGGAQGRHRSRRRVPRPLLIGGAAAAATLVVSLGVGAFALPGGPGGPGEPSAVDDTVAAAPAPPADEAFPGDALAAPAATASPTTARPTPSASPTNRPTPVPSRTTATSRRSVDRSPKPSSAATTAPAGGTVSAQAREIVDLVNAERAKAGCGALGIDDKLMTAAQRHSQDQADHQNMSHTGSDGSDAGDRLDRVGYAWRTYGENVAWNQKTPAAVMDAWMNSPGHRANILNCAFTEIGVGIASSNGPYWTQVFATPR